MSISGSCECGAVVFELSGPLREVIGCHCTQCRKTSGHYWAATSVSTAQVHLHQASDVARRGFCRRCGSSLFYELDGEGRTLVGAGTLGGATGLSTAKHIFVKDRGDYYKIACQAPQIARY